LITCLLASSLLSQDQWDLSCEVPIRQGLHLEWFRGSATRTVGELAGESAIVWSDCRSGDRGVYLQVFDAEGNPKFEENGILVADREIRQEDPSIAPCADGSWFVAWEDFAVDSLGNIRCTKVSVDGEIMWGNDLAGVPVCTVIHTLQEGAKILDDGDGGCILVWRDQRSGDMGDIFAQRILNNGHPDGRWEQNGIQVAAAPGFQGNFDITHDGENGVIIVWKDDRIDHDYNIWAQRLTQRGELLWGDGEGLQVCNQENNQEIPKICSDGDGGAFISWQDSRNIEESYIDIYVQRIDSEGSLMWSEADEGIPLCLAPDEQQSARIIESEPGSAIVVWEDRRNDRNTYDLFGMRVSGDEEMIRLWEGELGVPIAVAERNQYQFRLCPDENGGAFIVWEDERFDGFPEVDIWAQYINVDGEIQWDENGIVVCGASEDGDEGLFTQLSPLIFPTADQGCLAVWGDRRSGSRSIFSQKLNPEGDPQWEGNGVQLAEGLDGNALYQQIHSIGNGDFVITWLDGRGGRNSIPYIQYCTSDADRIMNTQFSANGIPITEPNENSAREVFSFVSEDNSTIIVWEDHRRGQNQSIYAQKISQRGEKLWGEMGIRCAEFEGDPNLSMGCNDENGGAFIVWRAANDNQEYNIFLQHMNADGERLWGGEGIQLTDNDVDEEVEHIISDGDGGAVILWIADDRETDDDLWIQRINSNGEKLWEDDRENYGKRICVDWNRQHQTKLLRHPDGFVVVWTDERDDELGTPQDDIFGQFILPDGTDLWVENGYLICGEINHQQNPDIAIDNDGFIWVVWDDDRYDNHRNREIFMQKLDHQVDEHNRPQHLFELYGIPVCYIERDQRNPDIIHDGQNGVWIAWGDCRREYFWSDLYATHLNPDGEPYDPWEEHGSIICNAFHKQSNPKLTLLNENGEGGAIVLWEDKRSTGHEELSNLYCRLLDDDLVSVPEPVITSPSNFTLYPAYPNPFNSTTTIEYALPFASEVSLNLYNLSGRRVETLVNGRMQAGVHRVKLDAGDMASGLYFLKLEGVGQSFTQKIMLVK